MSYHNLPPTQIDPSRQMFKPALGIAPGLGRMKGRRVLVVGAGQRTVVDKEPPIGNGRAISRLLAREGAAVACLDHSREAAETVCREIKEEGGTAFPIIADVTDVAQIKPALEQSAKLMGGLDGLVLSVGVTSVPPEQLTVEHWDWVFAVNLRSHMWFAMNGLEILEAGSSIVFISSRAGFRPGSRHPAYEMSKAGQYQLARNIALEGEPKGIRSNCVVVGPIDTPMGRDEARKRPNRASAVAFGRQGTGWEIAYTTLFLMSHESSYVNAQSLVVDGGQFYGVARKT